MLEKISETFNSTLEKVMSKFEFKKYNENIENESGGVIGSSSDTDGPNAIKDFGKSVLDMSTSNPQPQLNSLKVEEFLENRGAFFMDDISEERAKFRSEFKD